MRRVLFMSRAGGLLAVAGLSLLLTGDGAPFGEKADAPTRRPSVRESAGVVPQGLLGRSPVQRRLRNGQRHGWLLPLEAGDFAHVRIEQLGADLEVTLFDPAGHVRTTIDTPTPMGFDGEEHLFLHAKSTGMHRLALSAIDERDPDAAYRARLVERRQATRLDLVRLRAQELFHEAIVARVAGRNRIALSLLARAEVLFGRLGDGRLQAESRAAQCAVSYRMGEYRGAIPGCEAAAAYYRRQGLDADLASALTLHGRSLLNLDDPWSGLRSLEEALRVWERLEDPWNLALVHTDLGMAHRQLSEFPLALREFDLALELWERCEESDRAALVLYERGLLYGKLGRREAAIRDFREALARLEPDSSQRPLTLIALALALPDRRSGSAALEPLTEALGPLEEALEIEERRGNGGGMARVLAAIGVVQQRIGHPQEAVRLYQRALPLARAAGDRELLGDLYYNLAWLTGKQAGNDPIPLLEDALREYRGAGNREAQITALLGLATAERGAGRLHAGLQYFETARILFAELREILPSPVLKISFMAHRFRLFDSGIDLLMELHHSHPDQGWDARALEMSEQARSRALLDQVSRDASRRQTPGSEVLSLVAIQSRLLDPDTVALEYKLGAERSYLWVIEHDRLSSFELPPRGRLEMLAAAYNRRLARSSRAASSAALERTAGALSRALLCPARHLLEGRRLIVIADGELLSLPFAALGLGSCDGAEAGTFVPTAAGIPIVAAPSASTLAALRSRPRPPAERTVAVVANPVFDACDPRLDVGRRGLGCDGRFPSLPYTDAEARAILDLVPPGERTSIVGFDVQRRVLEDAVGGVRYLHFATHTDTSTDPPRLVLSQVDRQGRPIESPYLTVDDISELSLVADLVVLGACESGAGRRVRGEGLVGLAHAFFAAGAGGVLVTLWPIDDEATAAFMAGFYRRVLDEGLPPADALARTQSEISALPRWRSPYYWAGFVLLGQGVSESPVESRTGRSGEAGTSE